MNNPILLSHSISNLTPAYGGVTDAFSRHNRSCISCGDTSNSEIWNINNHFGTHVDCPFHFCENGKKLTDYLPAEWVFQSPFIIETNAIADQIIDLNEVRDSIPLETDFLIIKTGFEKFRLEEIYWKNNPGLSPELGIWLKENRPNVNIIGFDTISLTSFQNRELGRIAHKAFLSPANTHSGIRIIEDMKLATLKETPITIIISPLFISNSDSSPVTIWALKK